MFQTDAGTYQRTSGFTENQMELMMEQTARFRPAMIVPPGPPPPPSPPSPPPPLPLRRRLLELQLEALEGDDAAEL